MTLTNPDLLQPLINALSRPKAPSSDYDLNPDTILPEGRKLRPAGVLVALELTMHGPHVWLTKRSSALKHHPGQVAFPGGKQDDDDRDIATTALREASEEIGLPKENVKILGQWSAHETVTGFLVTPVIGQIIKPFEPKAEAGEVDEIFTVPLAHFLNRDRFRVESRRWRGQRRYYYCAPYGPYYVWGATARILRAISDAASLE